MNRIMKKLVPGVLAAALALGAVPSGITFDDILASATDPVVSGDISDYSVRYGATIGTEIGVKVIFNADDNVQVSLTDPDGGADFTTWTAYGTTANDNIIEVRAFPKNMDKKMTLTINGSSCQFSVDDYLTAVQGTASSLSNDKEKALYDLCNALMNYGDWCEFYFANKNKKFAAIDYSTSPANAGTCPGNDTWKQTWWTDPSNYWKTEDLGLDGKSFDDALGEYKVTHTDYMHNSGTGTGFNKVNYPYNVSMILGDQIKMRLYVLEANYSKTDSNAMYVDGARNLQGDKWTTATTGRQVPLNIKAQEFDGSLISYKYATFDAVPLGKMSKDIEVYSYGYWSTGDWDIVKISPLRYSKLVCVDKPNGDDFTYEHNGMANALRALVTVDAAMYKYEHS